MNWALQADVRTFLQGWQPFKTDLVGMKPKKDPLRKNPFPVEDRVELVAIMDEWELYQFALPLILPPRPEEFLGLLISDIDFEEREFFFGTRFGGSDFNKARVSFRIPFPAELTQILKRHIGERTEDPLILKRSVFEEIADLRRSKIPMSLFPSSSNSSESEAG